jgi:hypothetical protein
MKQSTIPALDVQVALELLRVDLLHSESNTWILKSTLRHGHNAVNELLRLARLYRRLERYVHTQPEGQYEGYGAVRIKYRDLVLGESRRTIYPAHKQPLTTPDTKVAAPKAPRRSRSQPASCATSKLSSASEQPKKPAGAVIATLRKATARPRKTK